MQKSAKTYKPMGYTWRYYGSEKMDIRRWVLKRNNHRVLRRMSLPHGGIRYSALLCLN